MNDRLIPTSFFGAEEANALAHALFLDVAASMDPEDPPGAMERPSHGPRDDPAGIEWKPFHTFNCHELEVDERFARQVLSRGLAMVVEGVPFTPALWTPTSFVRDRATAKCVSVDCITGTSQKESLGTFFKRFVSANRTYKLKVKSSQSWSMRQTTDRVKGQYRTTLHMVHSKMLTATGTTTL